MDPSQDQKKGGRTSQKKQPNGQEYMKEADHLVYSTIFHEPYHQVSILQTRHYQDGHLYGLRTRGMPIKLNRGYKRYSLALLRGGAIADDWESKRLQLCLI